jgi:hypothetical protein
VKLLPGGRLFFKIYPRQAPGEVEKQVGGGRLKMKPFVEKGLLKSLNPAAKKGRYYVASAKARRCLGLPGFKKRIKKDWDLIGWVKASPRQRLVILKAMDSAKRSSEEIRERASRSNPSLTRMLVESELTERKRYYWTTENGRMMREDLDWLLANKN